MGSGKACSGAAGVLACRIASVNCKTGIITEADAKRKAARYSIRPSRRMLQAAAAAKPAKAAPRADESGQRQRRREIPEKAKREIINARPRDRQSERAGQAAFGAQAEEARRKPRAAAKRRSAQSAARTPRQKGAALWRLSPRREIAARKCEVAIARGLTKNAAKTSGVSPPRHSKFENRKSRRDDSLTSITRASCKSQNESAAPLVFAPMRARRFDDGGQPRGRRDAVNRNVL